MFDASWARPGANRAAWVRSGRVPVGSQGTKIPKANSAGYSSPHPWDCRANALHYLPYSVAVCSVTSLSSFWWMAAWRMSWEACSSRSQVDNCCTSFSADLSLDSPRAETSPRTQPRAAGGKREDLSGRAGAAGATPAPHGALSGPRPRIYMHVRKI